VAIRKVCGPNLRQLHLELHGSNLKVHFAAPTEDEAERMADRIMYHTPELSRYAVQLEVEVPRN
jgi:hypothetical protein